MVAAVGENVDPMWLGRSVVVVSPVSCGTCVECVHARPCLHTKHIGVECWGGYADYVVVPELQLAAIPAGVDFADATYIARHYPMAISEIRTAAVDRGDCVLVMAAAGALGTLLVQLLHRRGAVVIAAAGTDEKVAHALRYGATFAINYRSEQLAARVRELTDGHGVRAVFENISDPLLWPGAFDSLGTGGTLVTAGYHGGGLVPLDVRRLYLQRLRVVAADAPRRNVPRDQLDEGMRLLTEGALRVPVGARIPLREAAEGHRLVESGAVPGKVVLIPDGQPAGPA